MQGSSHRRASAIRQGSRSRAAQDVARHFHGVTPSDRTAIGPMTRTPPRCRPHGNRSFELSLREIRSRAFWLIFHEPTPPNIVTATAGGLWRLAVRGRSHACGCSGVGARARRLRRSALLGDACPPRWIREEAPSANTRDFHTFAGARETSHVSRRQHRGGVRASWCAYDRATGRDRTAKVTRDILRCSDPASLADRQGMPGRL